MPTYTFTVVDIFSTLTVVGQVIAIVVLGFLLKDFFTKSESKMSLWISTHALLLMFIVALAATSGSLFFSEIAGWTPCKDCWFQRIFMYPEVLLLGIALWKRDRTIALYVLVFCVIGMVLALDHYMDQVEAALAPVVTDPAKPCDATGVSCAATQIHFTYGYITIPMMAFTAFLLNALGSISILRSKKIV